MSLKQKLRSRNKLKQFAEEIYQDDDEEENEQKIKEKKIVRKHKSKKKHHRKRRQQELSDKNQVKQQEKQQKKSKDKKRRHKSKKKKHKQDSQQVKKEQKITQKAENKQLKKHKKSKSKSKRKENTQQGKSEESQRQGEDKIEAIDVEMIKVEQQVVCISRLSSNRVRKKQFVSLQDSERIIYFFSLDAGDYKGLRQYLPHVGQRKIRNHLRVVFQYCLDKITQHVKESGRRIKEWQPHQKRQIIRQLHRIRSSNRLLSEANVQLRQTFHKIMNTYNNRQITLTDQQITFLFRKIQAFVRGYNHLNFFRKNYYVPPDQQDQRRKPIIEGGYIMQQKMQRQHKKQIQKYKPKVAKLDPQKMILEWTEEQEKQVCILYLDNNVNFQFIIENLRAKFGQSDKWRDFQILGKKIDHIIKLGLNRLQELTMKPYNRSQKMIEESRRAKMKEQAKKKFGLQTVKRQTLSKIQDFKQIIYYSSQLKDVKQGRLIKNPSLLLKQVFAHDGESFRVKHALVKLLVEKYPEQEQIEKTLKVIKDFTEWAAREQETNHVTMVRARLPVLDDGTKSRTYSLGQSDSDLSQNTLKHHKDEAEIAEGLTLLQDESDSELIKKQAQEQAKQKTVYFGNGRFNFDSNGNICKQAQRARKDNQSTRSKTSQSHKLQSTPKSQQGFIEVFQSQQSQYQGFITNKSVTSFKK